jgi:hypothetical protein
MPRSLAILVAFTSIIEDNFGVALRPKSTFASGSARAAAVVDLAVVAITRRRSGEHRLGSIGR